MALGTVFGKKQLAGLLRFRLVAKRIGFFVLAGRDLGQPFAATRG